MRRLLRWISILLVVLLVGVASILGYVYFASARLLARTYSVPDVPRVRARTDPASLARGKYLTERVVLCVDCHGEDLGGKVVQDSFALGRLASANLTRGRGGIGATHTDEDIVRAILHGVKPDGRSLVFMPSSDYRFTEADLGAILGYVRSMPAVDRERPTMSIGPVARALSLFTPFPLAAAARVDHRHVGLAPPPPSAAVDAAATGAYLVATAACRGCHGAGLTGGGGPPPGGANITPIGIGDWTEQDFLRALREHRRPNGSPIDEAMPRSYGQMSDDDLRAIFAYLRTVPAAGAKTANQAKGS